MTPLRDKLDKLQLWAIGTLLTGLVSLCGVIGYLIRRQAWFYQKVIETTGPLKPDGAPERPRH